MYAFFVILLAVVTEAHAASGMNYTRYIAPIKAGDTLFVLGVMDPEPTRLTINFVNKSDYMRGKNFVDGTRIPVHIDMRFIPDDPNIVMNSLECERWDFGLEKRTGNPLQKGKRFTVKVKVTEEFFEIYADGQKRYDYKPIFPFTEARYLNIFGDATLYVVCWNDSCDFKPQSSERPNPMPGDGCAVTY